MRNDERLVLEKWIMKHNAKTQQVPRFYTNTPQSDSKELAIPPLTNNMRVNNGSTPQLRAEQVREKIKTKDYSSSAVDTIVISGKKPKYQTIRKPTQGQICFVDWLNITFDIATINEKYRRNGEDDDTYMQMCQTAMQDVSALLVSLLGQRYAITSQRQTGANFYKYSFVIGEGYGMVCIGGQRDSILIMLNGTGCTLAPVGFEMMIHKFLTTQAVNPKITRIDLAHDDLKGDYLDVRELDNLESDGAFHCGGARPNVQHLGNWKHEDPHNKGLTLTIGQRSSGKFARFYQKGKQLGDKTGEHSNWVRAEVEYKSSDRVIPFDILLSPSNYFMGAYPVFDDLFYYDKTDKIETIQKTAEVTLNQSFDWIKSQAGKYFSFYRSFMSDTEILDMVMNDNPNAIPKRMHIPHCWAWLLANSDDPIEHMKNKQEFLTC